MPRPLRHPSRSASLSRRLGLALALWAAACGKNPQTVAPTTTPDAPAAKPAAKSELPARLEWLSTRLEAARVQHHIPGMAVAVVKGDEVVFAKGFGLADLETKRPVTPETVFAIGSTTKAFTSALVAMQVDAGKLKWDDPLSQHVPELQLRPRTSERGEATPVTTLRDALCHRSGFTRMSMLWASGALTVSEVLAQASGAEPTADFRKKFLYNNVVYGAAGEAAARSAGTTWGEMLHARVFEPLGMKSTNATKAAAEADPRRAQGYRWREVTEVHEALPMRSIDSVPAAGAINSNVLDMAQWLRLQLGRGSYEGKQLVSAERLQETWSPQIEVAGGIKYGLGWMLGDWQGHRVVEHGGNIDGYAAEVGMLPDDGIAYVLLTNVSMTGLQRESLGIVFDSLLGELPSEHDEGSALDLRPYTGRYVANFASFDDARFSVTDEGGKLFVDVPGQTKYELLPPNDEGRWVFALTDTIQVAFDLDEKGRAYLMHMHQGGFDFELPRQGYSAPPDFTLEQVQDQLGRYRAEGSGPEATVTLKDGRLVCEIKGQMGFVLRKPDAEGRWHFRAKDDIAVSFREDAKGAIDALVIHQGGTDVVLPRVATKEPPLPSVAQLLKASQAARFTKQLEKLGAVELTGKVRIPSSNVEGRFRLVFDAQHRQRMELDFGRYGRSIETYDGTSAWSVSTLDIPTEAQGRYLKQAGLASPLLAGDWTQGFDDATVEGRVGKGAEERIVVVLRVKDLPPMKLYVDPKRGDVRSTESITLVEGAGAIPNQSELGEFRKVLGLRLPHRISSTNEHSGPTILEVESVEQVKGDPAQLFRGPAKL